MRRARSCPAIDSSPSAPTKPPSGNSTQRVPPLETDLDGHTRRPAEHGERSVRAVHARRYRDRHRRHRRPPRARLRRRHGKPLGDLLGGHDVTEISSPSAPTPRSSPPAVLDGVSPCGTGPAGDSSRTSTPPGTARPTVAWDPHRPLLATSDRPRLDPLLGRQRPAPSRRHAEPCTRPAAPSGSAPTGACSPPPTHSARYTATVFDVATGHKLLDARRRQQLSEVSFTPDSRTLAAGHRRAQRRQGGPLRHDDLAPAGPCSFPTAANGLAFVDGGARFVTSSYPDRRPGRPLGHRDAPTGRRVPDASRPTTATPPPPTHAGRRSSSAPSRVSPRCSTSTRTSWQRTACRLAGRNLTRTEWAEYLPGPGLPQDVPPMARRAMITTNH